MNKHCKAYIDNFANIEKCELEEKLKILNDGKLVMKGGDYCYFKFPYESSYEELYGCLKEEGIENKYLSSYCE
jgi:hypothetical protein